MKEDQEIPIILGRPFLATAGTLIDVKNGIMSFNIGNEKVEFNLNKASRNPSFGDCYFLESIEEKAHQETLNKEQDPLKRCLLNEDALILDEEAYEYALMMDETKALTEEVNILMELKPTKQELEMEGKELDKVELKPLPPSLRYEFLCSNFPAIVKIYYWDEPLLFKPCHLPVELEHKVLWVIKALRLDLKSIGKRRLLQLNKLDEIRLEAYERSRIYKKRIKKWHNKLITRWKSQVGDKVPLFKSRLKLLAGKLKSKWAGQFQIHKVFLGWSCEANKRRVKHLQGGQANDETLYYRPRMKDPT